MTLLSVLGSNAIAVPLSPAFPAGELRYILDQSGALMLLSSAKFASKAEEVLKEGLEHKPIDVKVDKALEGSTVVESPKLEEMPEDRGGMMLYTSGTTARPVNMRMS